MSWSTILVAAVLTLLTAMGAYFANSPLGSSESLFLFMVFLALVVGVRWVWGRVRRGRGGRR